MNCFTRVGTRRARRCLRPPSPGPLRGVPPCPPTNIMENLFTISGIVTPSSQRGRSLGFPTANLNISADELDTGIYFAQAYYEEKAHPALLFIGAALTFGDMAKKVEVYMLDEIGDWYGHKIRVEALKKVRENIKFDTKDELIAQMEQDKKAAHEYFESLSKSE